MTDDDKQALSLSNYSGLAMFHPPRHLSHKKIAEFPEHPGTSVSLRYFYCAMLAR